MDYIFVTGKVSLQTLNTVFIDIFQAANFQVKELKFEYNISKNLTVVVDCDLGKLDFNLNEYKAKAFKLKPNLKAIICLDCLNPRPESLFTNVELLRSVFDLNELKSKTYFLFTYSNKELTQNRFRDDAMHFNLIYELFHISDNQRKSFVDNKIWLIDAQHLETFRNTLCLKIQSSNSVFFQLFIACILVILLVAVVLHTYYYCFSGLPNDSSRCLINFSNKTNFSTTKTNEILDETKNISISITSNHIIPKMMNLEDYRKLICALDSQGYRFVTKEVVLNGLQFLLN